MRLEHHILAAVVLDLILGDPRWLPHPVRGIGWLASRLETISRRWLGATRFAGASAAMAVYLTVGAGAWAGIRLADAIEPLAANAVSIFLIYSSIAARDLATHAMAVHRALAAGDLIEARRRVGMIVGRDTDRLDEADISRATVESVAESTVDGVTAPLFYAVIAGPIGAIVYRAINTLDSMFGHQDERYGRFGWAAARIDDLANYIPARCTAPLICLGAFLLRLRPGDSFRVLLRDGRKHPSPNAGLTEAAMAGALGVQLGGVSHYDGQPLDKPTLGEPISTLGMAHIRSAIALMWVTVGLFLGVSLVARFAAARLWEYGGNPR